MDSKTCRASDGGPENRTADALVDPVASGERMPGRTAREGASASGRRLFMVIVSAGGFRDAFLQFT